MTWSVLVLSCLVGWTCGLELNRVVIPESTERVVRDGNWAVIDRAAVIREKVGPLTDAKAKQFILNDYANDPNLLWDDVDAAVECTELRYITKCDCVTREKDCYACDGTDIANNGKTCRAYNSAHGQGVRARAECTQFWYDERSDAGTDAEVECDEGFKPLFCTIRQQDPRYTVLSAVKDGRKCKRDPATVYPAGKTYRVFARCFLDL